MDAWGQGEQREALLSEDNLLNRLIQDFNFPFNIELNLCFPRNLGNELFLDSRLGEELKNEDKERLNKNVAGKTFKELYICYCCYSDNFTFKISKTQYQNVLNVLDADIKARKYHQNFYFLLT